MATNNRNNDVGKHRNSTIDHDDVVVHDSLTSRVFYYLFALGILGFGTAAKSLIFLVVGVILVCWSSVDLFNKNKTVRLSLTSDGLRDHRNDLLLPWTQFRGLRLYTKITNGWTSSATMYVKVPHETGYKEIAFDVDGLDRSSEDIAHLVQQRGLEALTIATGGKN